jgi:hypothetical protein
MLASLRLCTSDYERDGIFNLDSPASTAPSSPTSDLSEYEVSLGDEETTGEVSVAQFEIREQTMVEKLVMDLVQASARSEYSSLASSKSSQTKLLRHLYMNAVTLADVAVIVPALNHKPKVMEKLSINIGYFHTYGSITAAALDHILIHLFTKGAVDGNTFEDTLKKIAYFKNEACRHKLELRQLQNKERTRHKAHTKKLDREAVYRRSTIPVELKEPKMSGTIPVGCKCIGDIITECYSMTWPEYCRLLGSTRTKNAAKIRAQVFKLPKLQAEIETEFGDEMAYRSDDFSRTRKHNGPGLQDRKWPKVLLPQTDTRDVVTKPEDIQKVEEKTSSDGFRWAKTKPSFDFLYEKKIKKLKRNVVVKLPSQS